MKQLDLEDILANKGLREGIVDAVKSGAIFIYPTDTVYGIGCNAEKDKSVQKIREIKCTDHPFSVIAPSIKWITDNLSVNENNFLEKLPGPYTLIFQKNINNLLSAASPGDSLGVRIPKHPFTELVSSAGVPFVTTSANISGQPTIKLVNKIPEQMLEMVDYVIDAGKLGGKASQVIDLTGETPTILRK